MHCMSNAYTGGEAWVIRILAIVAVLFILVVVTAIIVEGIKRYKKMWDEISQMFLIGSLSEITAFATSIISRWVVVRSSAAFSILFLRK